MKCPQCGTESSGNFCPSCGASMRAAHCPHCGGALLPGAKFCTKCGKAVAGGTGRSARARGPAAGGGSSNLPWYIAAGVLLLIIAVLLVPMLIPDDGAQTAGPPLAPAGGNAGAPGPLTGTPREQADRLFNRIMTAQDQGDTANAKFFAPMGIQAYQMAQPLDHDGLYHLATIHAVAGDFAAARTTAEQILAANPNHLLGLAAAADAATRAGDTAAARGYYQRFLNSYDAEIARGLQEYQDHSRILPELRTAARGVVGG